MLIFLNSITLSPPWPASEDYYLPRIVYLIPLCCYRVGVLEVKFLRMVYELTLSPHSPDRTYLAFPAEGSPNLDTHYRRGRISRLLGVRNPVVDVLNKARSFLEVLSPRPLPTPYKYSGVGQRWTSQTTGCVSILAQVSV